MAGTLPPATPARADPVGAGKQVRRVLVGFFAQADPAYRALPKLFSSDWRYGGITLAAESDTLLPNEIRQPMFIAMDPPEHTAQRRTVAPSFGPSEVAAMKEECRARTAEVLDALPIGEAFDWVQRVSIELTTGQLAKLFGFPWEERHKLTEWSDYGGDITMFRDADALAARNAKMQEMGMAFAALWQERMANQGAAGGKDLISVMIQSDAMNHMSEEEFIGNLILLIVGGNDTTRNSMSGYAYGLNQFPEEREKLEQNPDLIPNAVQEIIRWQTPLAHMRRVLTEDTDMFGHDMKKGDRVALWYISANRDEESSTIPMRSVSTERTPAATSPSDTASTAALARASPNCS